MVVQKFRTNKSLNARDAHNGESGAERAFKRELLFTRGRFKTKRTLKVDQLFSIALLSTSPRRAIS